MVIIEDDWELMGNGLGNVAHLQYLPALFLMDKAAELGLGVSFMVDAMQQLAFLEHADRDPQLRLQARLWRDTVGLMRDRGFDVQLHMHPQWASASLRDGYFHVDDEWNLGRWPDKERGEMVRRSAALLCETVRQADSDYQLRAFKAGSWGLQPSGGALRDLRAVGIRLVMAPRRGMYLPTAGVDFRRLEEDTRPYRAQLDDIQRVAEQDQGILVVPLAWYRPTLAQAAGLLLSKLRKASLSPDRTIHQAYHGAIPSEVLASGPALKPSTALWGERRYLTHLKIGDQPFSYLKRSFAAVVERVSQLDAPFVALVIECHTKQLLVNYQAIGRFLEHLARRWSGRVEFGDAAALLDLLEKNPRYLR